MKEREELNVKEQTFDGEKCLVTMKKPTTAYEHGQMLFEQYDSLGPGMKMPQIILARAEDSDVVCYDSEFKKGNEIGFVGVLRTSDKEYKKKEVAEKIGKGILKGKIISGDVSKSTFEIEMYLEEATAKMVDGQKVNAGQFNEAMTAEMQRIIDEGISTKEVLEKNIEVMRNNRVGDARILAVLKKYKKYDKPAWVPDAYYVDVNPEMPKSILNKALKASLISGHALIFEGDKSVGKNVCGETIAAVRGMPYYFMGFDAYMTTDTVYGESKTDNSAGAKIDMEGALNYVKATTMPDKCSAEELEKAAEFEMLKAKASTVQIIREYSELVKWAQTGGVMMLNEYNMGDANLKQQFMNPMLDSTRALDVPGIGMLRLNPDCVLIASANPGFVGEMAENGATRSRLGTIKFPNASEIIKQLKSSLGENFVPEKYFEACNNYYKAIKGMVGTISDQCLNIRGFKRALEDVKQDIDDGEEVSLADDIITEVIYGCPEEDIPNLMLQLNEIVEI